MPRGAEGGGYDDEILSTITDLVMKGARRVIMEVRSQVNPDGNTLLPFAGNFALLAGMSARVNLKLMGKCGPWHDASAAAGPAAPRCAQ
jgi:hypothetical protein